MNLEQLKGELTALSVVLSITAEGKLKYDAPSPIPARVVEGMREHKTSLLAGVEAAPAPRVKTRPALEERASMAGHCGTCRAFTLAPDEGRYMGVCSHGCGAFEPWVRHSGLPAVVHEAARCMTEPFPRWVLRAGVTARPDTDFPRGGKA